MRSASDALPVCLPSDPLRASTDGDSFGEAFLVLIPVAFSFMTWHLWCYFDVTSKSAWSLASVLM